MTTSAIRNIGATTLLLALVAAGLWFFFYPGGTDYLGEANDTLPPAAEERSQPNGQVPARNAEGEARGESERPAVAEELDAMLVATVVRPDPAASFASISRRNGSDNRLVGVGDRLEIDTRARLVVVGDGYVEIDLAGQMLRLTSASRLDPLAEQFLEAIRNAPPREIDAAERARRQAMAERLRALMDAPTSTRVRGTGAFAEAHTSTHWDGDRLSSIELDDIEPGGLYDELGFENGDRIATINGIAVGDDDAGTRILKELVSSGEIVAGVERAGGPGEVAIPSEELMQQLRDRLPDLSAEELQALDDFSRGPTGNDSEDVDTTAP